MLRGPKSKRAVPRFRVTAPGVPQVSGASLVVPPAGKAADGPDEANDGEPAPRPADAPRDEPCQAVHRAMVRAGRIKVKFIIF